MKLYLSNCSSLLIIYSTSTNLYDRPAVACDKFFIREIEFSRPTACSVPINEVYFLSSSKIWIKLWISIWYFNDQNKGVRYI